MTTQARAYSVSAAADLAPGACGRPLKSGRFCNHVRDEGLDVCRMHAFAERRRGTRHDAQRAAMEREALRVVRRRELVAAAEQARGELVGGFSVVDGYDARRLSVLLAALVAAVDRWHEADADRL